MEDDLKNEDNLKNEDDLKNENNLSRYLFPACCLLRFAAFFGMSRILRVTPTIFGLIRPILDIFGSILANFGNFLAAFSSMIWINKSGVQ